MGLTVVPSLLPLAALVAIDLAVAWRFGNLEAARAAGGSLAAELALTALNGVATWLVLLSLAYLAVQGALVRGPRTLRLAVGALMLLALLVFVFYLGFAWGFVAFNGFSPSFDAVWFLLLNAARLPEHLLQSSLLPALLGSAAVLAIALALLLSLRRLAQVEPRRRGRRVALAALALGLAGALATAPGTTANVAAVGFTQSTLRKLLETGRSYAATVDPAAVLAAKQTYRPRADVPSRPIVVLMVEALRRDLLLTSPSPMPFLAGLREKAVWFDKAYATASHSNYADLAFWYAQYPLRSVNFFWTGYPRDAAWRGPSLFSVAKQHGFATAYISSQDENWGEMINWLDVPGEVDFFFHAPDYEGHRWFDPSLKPAAAGPGILTAGKLEDSATLAVALDWIRSLEGNRRFVLGMNLQNTHFSYVLPAGAETPYQPAELPPGAVYYKWPEAAKTEMKNRYLNAAWNLDRLIAGFVDELKRAGLWDDCVFVVVGDSGEAFYEHGFGNHSGPMYDEVMRTLALLKPPKGSPLAPGPYLPAISHLDLVPTVLDLAGMPLPDSFQGVSLLAERPRRRLFMHTNAAVKQHGLVEWPWKLLHTYYPYDRQELYDLETDPKERRDLIAAEPARARALGQTLDAWIAEQLLYYGDAKVYGRYAPPHELDLAAPAAGG